MAGDISDLIQEILLEIILSFEAFAEIKGTFSCSYAVFLKLTNYLQIRAKINTVV